MKKVWTPGLNLLNAADIIPSFSLHLMISLRSFIKHSKDCFIRYPDKAKWDKKSRLRLVF